MVFFLPPISVIQIRAKTSLFTIKTVGMNGNKTMALNIELNFSGILAVRFCAAKTSLFTNTAQYELFGYALRCWVDWAAGLCKVSGHGASPDLVSGSAFACARLVGDRAA
jgi:hypothetical protein